MIVILCDHRLDLGIFIVDLLHAGACDVDRSVFDVDRRIIAALDGVIPHCLVLGPRACRAVGYTQHGIGIELVGDHVILICLQIISAVRGEKADCRSRGGAVCDIQIHALISPVA